MRNRKKRYTTDMVVHKDCAFCGKDFGTFSKKQIYCSTECLKKQGIEKHVKPHRESSEDIYRRDDYKCVYCGKSSIEDGVRLVVDHVYPVSKGGGAGLVNLVTSCFRCNIEKQDKMLSKDIILRIWDRNDKLNENLSQITYEKLKKHFAKNLILRRKKFPQFNGN